MSQKHNFNSIQILKIGAIVGAITGVIILSLVILPISQAAPGAFPQAAPSPRPPLKEDSSGGSSGPSSAIYGTVTDLSRQQPGAAIEVTVNGAIVRTDTDGSYSITGLKAGDYTVSLNLNGQGQPAQGPVHVTLDGSHNAVIELEYYSQAAPTDTPQPTATVAVVSATTTPAELPDSGASMVYRPLVYILLGLLLLVTGMALFTKNRANHQNSTDNNQQR
ncbi:MAG: hypothetical protein FOGNACKC_04705 [Anaerolineae bacterium]|nr:hypothetical protein [Anaerolineae bacterium]